MATTSRKDLSYMDPEEFRQLGILQEVNRQFFHPIGLALAVGIDDSGKAVAIAGVLDNRDDPEGFIYDFGDGEDEAIRKAIEFRKMRVEAHERRQQTLGYVIQGFDWKGIAKEEFNRLREAREATNYPHTQKMIDTIVALVDARLAGLPETPVFDRPDTVSSSVYHKKWKHDPDFAQCLETVTKLAQVWGDES